MNDRMSLQLDITEHSSQHSPNMALQEIEIFFFAESSESSLTFTIVCALNSSTSILIDRCYYVYRLSNEHLHQKSEHKSDLLSPGLNTGHNRSTRQFPLRAKIPPFLHSRP
jgi:hypothetical protein